MNHGDDELTRDLPRAFGRDLPGEEFDRAVLDRIADGGGEQEVALAAPRPRHWVLPALAAAVLAFLFLRSPGVPAPADPDPVGTVVLDTQLVAAADAFDVPVRVTNVKDQGVAGAKLLGVIKTWPGGQYRQDAISGETGEDGNHVFPGLAPKEGQYAIHLAAFAPGYVFESRYQLVKNQAPGQIRFSLAPADPVTVRFLTEDGKPVPGVLVRPASRKPPKGDEHSVYMVAAAPLVRTAGEDGTVVLDHFAKGDRAMVACRFPSTAWEERKFTVTGEVVEIRAGLAPEPPGAEDVAGVPAEDLRAGGDEQKRYFLIGPTGIEKKPPREGFGLLLVLPGGDGSADFQTFVKRIARNALDETWIVAELVSVAWTPEQRIVWPTERNKVAGMHFTTEEFIEAVVKDVAKRRNVNRDRVLILGWSSSGPALYAAMLQKRTPLKGAFVAMSVFKPDLLPSLRAARGRRFYILHSPDDEQCPYRMAEQARDDLEKAGAKVKIAKYPGGHGWSGNVYGRIKAGVTYLSD